MQQAADAVSVASLRPSQLQVQAAGGAGWTQIPRRWNTSTRRSCGRRRCAGRGRAVSSRVAGGAGRGHDGARCDKWRRTSKSGGVAGGRSGGSCGVAGAGNAKRDGAASTRARARRVGVGRYRLPRTVFHLPSRPGAFQAVGSGSCGQDWVEEVKRQRCWANRTQPTVCYRSPLSLKWRPLVCLHGRPHFFSFLY